MELTKEVIEKLSAPVPSSAIQSKKQGGRDIRFTSDKFVINRLDTVVGVEGWEDRYITTTLSKPVVLSVTGKGTERERATYTLGQLVCELTVCGVTKSGAADLEYTEGMYGSPATNAQARAFKRAAMKFGIAAELWTKDEVFEEGEIPNQDHKTASRTTSSQSSSQSAKTNQPVQQRSDGPSLKQVDWLSGDQFRVPVSIVNQLTGGRGGSASAMIDALRRIKQEAGKAYAQDPTPFIRKALVEVGEQRIADSLPRPLSVVAGPADDDEDDED